jgi:bacterioferritin
MKQPFKTDLGTIRARARDKMMEGAITGAYQADREQGISVLNEVLATEIGCVLRYKNHYFMASGINAGPIAAELLQHANEEQMHADWDILKMEEEHADDLASTLESLDA